MYFMKWAERKEKKRILVISSRACIIYATKLAL